MVPLSDANVDMTLLKKMHILCAAAVVLAAVALAGCASHKNTAANRRYQEFITRYNIYYNGDQHFKETLDAMERGYEDDYSRTLFMHPVEAKNQEGAPQPSGDFTRSIEKAQKAIQLRSIKKKPKRQAGKRNDPKYKEWMSRDEYNPFLHNAWMMMGRSQYYNGDFAGAASTFLYISRHFSWLPATVTEARLMHALCYIAMGWQFEAESILSRVKLPDMPSNRLRRLYNFAWADFYIHAHNYEEAIPFLVEAVKGARGAQKTRLRFLLGQTYQRLGRNNEAYKAFSAAEGASSASYRTKFNARIKQSEVYSGADIEPEIKALRRMTRYGRNKEYLDQIYYAIGNLYLSRGDTARAIESYEIANRESTRNGIDKAINQLRLGELYFLQGDYAKAQPAYSEAVPQLPSTYPGYDGIRRRSDVLDELAVYSQNVCLQDSLLRLAAMTPEQRAEVINRIIRDLKEKEKKEAEDARREEFLAENPAGGSGLTDNNTQTFTINTDNSWYFYNNAVRNAGRTEFQRRWGARKLEDNWRRRDKASFATADDSEDSEISENPELDENSDNSDDTTEVAHRNDPHYPEYYLAQIPQSDLEKANAHSIIQEGLYNMGVILKDKLEDYPASRREFDRLLTEYPDNIYRLDAYYNLYLMYIRHGDTAEAERFRKLILSDFPDSKYGMALRNPDYIENLRDMDRRVEDLYEKTYEAYLNNRNDEVHSAYETMNEKFPHSKTMPKFMFLHALAYVTEHDKDNFNATLRDLLDRYPDTDITPFAASWLKGMSQGRQLMAGSGNMRGMIWDMRLTNDSTLAAADSVAGFELNPDSRQVLVFSFPTDKVSSNDLLYRVARHNFTSFVVKDFDLEQMNFGALGLLVVSGFDNQRELDHYRNVMASSSEFRLPAGVRPIAISESNFRILLDQGRSFEEYFRYLEGQNYIDAQAGIIPVEEIEELPEETETQSTRNPQAPQNTQDTQKPQATTGSQRTTAEPEEPEAPKPAPILPAGSEGDDPLLDE